MHFVYAIDQWSAGVLHALRTREAAAGMLRGPEAPLDAEALGQVLEEDSSRALVAPAAEARVFHVLVAEPETSVTDAEDHPLLDRLSLTSAFLQDKLVRASGYAIIWTVRVRRGFRDRPWLRELNHRLEQSPGVTRVFVMEPDLQDGRHIGDDEDYYLDLCHQLLEVIELSQGTELGTTLVGLDDLAPADAGARPPRYASGAFLSALPPRGWLGARVAGLVLDHWRRHLLERPVATEDEAGPPRLRLPAVSDLRGHPNSPPNLEEILGTLLRGRKISPPRIAEISDYVEGRRSDKENWREYLLSKLERELARLDWNRARAAVVRTYEDLYSDEAARFRASCEDHLGHHGAEASAAALRGVSAELDSLRVEVGGGLGAGWVDWSAESEHHCNRMAGVEEKLVKTAPALRSSFWVWVHAVGVALSLVGSCHMVLYPFLLRREPNLWTLGMVAFAVIALVRIEGYTLDYRHLRHIRERLLRLAAEAGSAASRTLDDRARAMVEGVRLRFLRRGLLLVRRLATGVDGLAAALGEDAARAAKEAEKERSRLVSAETTSSGAITQRRSLCDLSELKVELDLENREVAARMAGRRQVVMTAGDLERGFRARFLSALLRDGWWNRTSGAYEHLLQELRKSLREQVERDGLEGLLPSSLAQDFLAKATSELSTDHLVPIDPHIGGGVAPARRRVVVVPEWLRLPDDLQLPDTWELHRLTGARSVQTFSYLHGLSFQSFFGEA